jgi:hypothetical protein
LSGNVGGCRRAAAAAKSLRVDLNETPRSAGPVFAKRVFELLAEAEGNGYPDMDGQGAREAAASLSWWEAADTLVANGVNPADVNRELARRARGRR